MKKLVAAIVATACLSITMSFAGINEKALNQFNSSFGNATDVKWTENKDYVKASCLINSQKVEVYYTPAGEMIGKCRYISQNELPMGAAQTIENSYPNFTVSEVIEYQSLANGERYYASLYNGTKKVIVEISPQGEVSMYKRSRIRFK